jgi:hypothetical protein
MQGLDEGTDSVGNRQEPWRDGESMPMRPRLIAILATASLLLTISPASGAPDGCEDRGVIWFENPPPVICGSVIGWPGTDPCADEFPLGTEEPIPVLCDKVDPCDPFEGTQDLGSRSQIDCIPKPGGPCDGAANPELCTENPLDHLDTPAKAACNPTGTACAAAIASSVTQCVSPSNPIAQFFFGQLCTETSICAVATGLATLGEEGHVPVGGAASIQKYKGSCGEGHTISVFNCTPEVGYTFCMEFGSAAAGYACSGHVWYGGRPVEGLGVCAESSVVLGGVAAAHERQECALIEAGWAASAAATEFAHGLLAGTFMGDNIAPEALAFRDQFAGALSAHLVGSSAPLYSCGA